jgi:hypothetical protein
MSVFVVKFFYKHIMVVSSISSELILILWTGLTSQEKNVVFSSFVFVA